jgi:hypothetical protein
VAAFNWIDFQATCPECGRHAPVRARTHVASSRAGLQGAFHDRLYALGERMPWWPPDHPEYVDWRDERGWVVIVSPSEVRECCRADCRRCDAELFAVIRFVDLVPTAVEAVGYDRNWPAEFAR